jgi:hypothetical protein
VLIEHSGGLGDVIVHANQDQVFSLHSWHTSSCIDGTWAVRDERIELTGVAVWVPEEGRFAFHFAFVALAIAPSQLSIPCSDQRRCTLGLLDVVELR